MDRAATAAVLAVLLALPALQTGGSMLGQPALPLTQHHPLAPASAPPQPADPPPSPTALPIASSLLCTAGLEIAHSNRTTAAPCRGTHGDECAYSCNAGYFARGRHVCQTYADPQHPQQPFLNNTFFGGHCEPLCSAPACSANEVPMRTNTSAGCYATMCFPSADAALLHIARGNYEVWQRARWPRTGMYIDNVDLVGGTSSRMAASGVSGLGLVFECVGHALNFSSLAAAQQRVITTLESFAGQTPGFALPRSQHGFFPHFYDADTGNATGDPEACMMCTGLLMAGVLFARTYFRAVAAELAATARIDQLASQLWNTTHFDRLLCDSSGRVSATGTGIPMIQLLNDSCQATQYPQPDGFYEYNEEHYTVWFAYEKACSGQPLGSCSNKAIETMWQRWLGRRLHPNHSYRGNPLLSMWSGYIVHLPYFMTHSFNSDEYYSKLFASHWQADRAFYHDEQQAGEAGRYGLGAGPTPQWCSEGAGYLADRIDEGSSFCRMYSPYITAGYLPAEPETITADILDILADGDAVLPFNVGDHTNHPVNAFGTNVLHILWRKSMLDPAWLQGYGITMVDFSSELLGLSTRWLGKAFYQKYTNHFGSAKPVSTPAK